MTSQGVIRLVMGSQIVSRSEPEERMVGQWAHIAFQLDHATGLVSVWANGASVDLPPEWGWGESPIGDDPLILGFSALHPDNLFLGHIGPFRISEGHRYSEDFAPTWGWEFDETTIGLWNVWDASVQNSVVLNGEWTGIDCIY